jgi:hypothetical protein
MIDIKKITVCPVKSSLNKQEARNPCPIPQMAVPTPRMNTNITANQSVITERTIINKATTLEEGKRTSPSPNNSAWAVPLDMIL